MAAAVSADDRVPATATVKELRLISAGEDFIRRMKDLEVDAEDLMSMAQQAIARKEFAGMLAARDERGRTPLHVATTRGDVGLCAKMLAADPGIVNAIDGQKNTALMEAALLGRSLITKELLEHAADVRLKNAELMNALQLACVNEAAGNGQVIFDLVQAGADPSAMCWQVTPLMAAADSSHVWAIQTLIDLGADPWQMNSSSFTGLDYARDNETAQMLYDVMQGDRLSDKPAPRFDTQRLFRDAEARRAKLHKTARRLTLAEALSMLELPSDWLPDFEEKGLRFNEIRKAWRKMCLRCHPDKQPEGLEEEEAAEYLAGFQRAMAAFEAVESHYRKVCTDDEARQEDPS